MLLRIFLIERNLCVIIIIMFVYETCQNARTHAITEIEQVRK